MVEFVPDGSKCKIFHLGYRTNKSPDTTTTTPSSIDKQPQRGSSGEKNSQYTIPLNRSSRTEKPN